MARNFHLPGRSPMLASDAMAATSHPLATQAALEIMRAGGTAADAAVAACAVLCVVEPAMTGIGGDNFCLVAKPGKPVWGYNGSGRTSAKFSFDSVKNEKDISMDSVHAATVPGAIEAWAAILEAHGKFDLGRVLEAAIHYAENGFPVAPRVAHDWGGQAARLAKDPGAAQHYLKNGKAPQVGDVMRAPALAQTFRAIAKNGPRAFYEGAIAEEIAATLKARGGFITAEDMARHKGEEVTPIKTRYRDRDVVQLPPNGQGLAALVLLNILETFDLKSLDPLGAERLHISIEASRLAYAVRDTHVAEPSAMRIAVEKLIDKAFGKSLAAKIDRTKRVPLPNDPTPGNDTVYLTVVDRDRTAVSFINSLYGGFGVGICTPKSGVMLQNRGACFVTTEGHPNQIAPNKRPMHTIIPSLSMRGDQCDMSFGVMGGSFQSMGHAYFVSNLTDYGMDVQQAIDHPRLFQDGETTMLEAGVPQAVADQMTAMGHKIARRPDPLGGGQAIVIDWERGVLIGGSDPRKDGSAAGY
ncbi:putative gamma-glutamyltransferase YwrD [Variibacter gotjawalensis]|uniref:Glutathione hydrolase proenzyme n=1 Tax=Variibacter gotjawalensis TaxID=1333996 RepID=A0A0S3PQT2_9BRAD|nr:gamma-glutamyltransferase [Variibacter gotjawalensis]NIK48617.1 gamma-glutamyltranspeptidase/glutathione hydrolase [Variibacter gotjawalensis]RZS50481.1 gamma-glutamyltransferase 2 [Variibacter gotjawalensis]BAT58315.1 putative gamma-glutamyltransferase YwrD [Variibacter gotjawalensis]